MGGVVAGAAVLILIHIVGSVVGEMVCWWMDKGKHMFRISKMG